MCSAADDEHCLREWLSASGGWVAIAAAYFTIKAMREDIEATNRHHRDNMELQLQGMRDTIRSATIFVHNVEIAIGFFIKNANSRRITDEDYCFSYLGDMMRWAEEDSLNKLINDFGGMPHFRLKRLKEAVESTKTTADYNRGKPEMLRELVDQTSAAANLFSLTLKDCRNIIEERNGMIERLIK